MKNKYDNIDAKGGEHKGNLVKLQIIPIEFLMHDLEINFQTGNVFALPEPLPGKSYSLLNVVHETIKFNQNPKRDKAGTYFDTLISCKTNHLSPLVLQTLETYRHHKLLAVVMDEEHKFRIVGDKENGLEFDYSIEETSADGGSVVIEIVMKQQFEKPAPYIRS